MKSTELGACRFLSRHATFDLRNLEIFFSRFLASRRTAQFFRRELLTVSFRRAPAGLRRRSIAPHRLSLENKGVHGITLPCPFGVALSRDGSKRLERECPCSAIFPISVEAFIGYACEAKFRSDISPLHGVRSPESRFFLPNRKKTGAGFRVKSPVEARLRRPSVWRLGCSPPLRPLHGWNGRPKFRRPLRPTFLEDYETVPHPPFPPFVASSQRGCRSSGSRRSVFPRKSAPLVPNRIRIGNPAQSPIRFVSVGAGGAASNP